MEFFGNNKFSPMSCFYAEEANSPVKRVAMENNDLFTPVKCEQSFVSVGSPSNNDSGYSQKSSTPLLHSRSIFQPQQQHQFSTPNVLLESYRNSLLAIQASAILRSTNKPISKRRPKVNFHSIDDLVGNSIDEEKSEVDSGVSSIAQSTSSYTSSPVVVDNYSRGLSLYKQAFENFRHLQEESEDKENSEQEKKIVYEPKKSNRTAFTDQQKQALEVFFQQNPYPDPKEAEDLSQQLSLPENVIKVWFQNKRSRSKQRKFTPPNRSTKCNNAESATTNNAYSPLITNLQLLSQKLNRF